MIAARLELEFDAVLGGRFDDAREAGRRGAETFAAVGAAEYPGRYRAAYRGPVAPAAGPRSSRQALPVDVPAEAEVDAEQPA
jgi:hypothetical protein